MANTSPTILYEGGVKLEKSNTHEVYDEKLGVSRLYTDKNELLILIASGYSSTWSANPINLLMDARVIWFFYDTYIIPCECGCNGFVRNRKVDEAPMQTFLEGLGYHDVYLRGFQNLAIEIVPPNKKFRVIKPDGLDDYEGYSSLEIFYNDDDLFTS